ncbi:MAG: hypothetical protein CMJ77_19510 [Planctomycetaceae bacterium]|nr:hypothetical protein [Planctomycetaceae bacterium]
MARTHGPPNSLPFQANYLFLDGLEQVPLLRFMLRVDHGCGSFFKPVLFGRRRQKVQPNPAAIQKSLKLVAKLRRKLPVKIAKQVRGLRSLQSCRQNPDQQDFGE